MYAANGTFWFSRSNEIPKIACGGLRGSRCPAGNETVLWVDPEGRAILVYNSFLNYHFYLGAFNRKLINTRSRQRLNKFISIQGLAFYRIWLLRQHHQTHSLPAQILSISCTWDRARISRVPFRAKIRMYLSMPDQVCSPARLHHYSSLHSMSADEFTSSFNWLGSDNPCWFLCPGKRALDSYQVQKEVTVNSPAQAGCLSGILLIAVDYSGPSPAAGVYL